MKRSDIKRTSIGYFCTAIILGGAVYGQTVRADGLSGLYIGGNFGRAQNEYDTAFVDDQYRDAAKDAGNTLKYTASSVQRTDNTWWANAGYMIWPYIGIDAAFLHLGELTHRATGDLEMSSRDYPAFTTATITSHGPALSLLARLPLAESLDVDIRLGDYYGKTTQTTGFDYKSKFAMGAQSTTASSLLAGVGAAYTFAWHWSIRLDYLRVNQAGNSNTVGKYNVNLETAGVTFTF
jgi:hypothetical protein